LKVGRRIPLYCGAAGKTLVAFDHPSVLEQLLATDLKAYTPNTIADPEALKAEIEEARRRGWGFENQEFTPGASGIGAPIWDSAGCVTGAIAIRAPSMRMPFKEAAAMAPSLMKAAADISTHLGYTGAQARFS
jgi:IclR family transcriptional regulator, acetate operon repressor